MLSYRKPLNPDTLVIELNRDDALRIHGEIVSGNVEDSALLSLLESFYAGTAPIPYANQGSPAPVPFTERKTQ